MVSKKSGEKEEKKAIVISLPGPSWKSASIFLMILVAVSIFFNFRFYRTGMVTLPGGSKISGLVIIRPPGFDTSQVNRWAKEVGISTTSYDAEWVNGPVGLLFTNKSVSILDLSTRVDFLKSICDQTKNQRACELSGQAQAQAAKESCENVKKTDKPNLDAFVVSYCPFGLQMQRILVDVKKLIEDKADITIRYIGSVENGQITAMHGEKEATENLRQICIREEQKDKFWAYIECFIKKGEFESCLTATNIDKVKLDECMKPNSKGIDYAKVDFELQNRYGVSGSPTLILNGNRVSEFDFGGRTSEAVKSLLCCGFTTQPDECSQELSTQQAATGFSETYSAGSSGTGSC